ncbi:hypothetical protein E1264_03400 [Actinomadura sp. KC216]|uniref:hypothetical protein n=1 Tax=Actinomadura sp. KC216 TaxID=2530370 RepID=UPI00104DD0FD|nr:hypothetical protein [Actinomadura sp. KC216]TDB90885.1 hypothetical protein E1264_03400 [Actinomadura sp. KC216]
MTETLTFKQIENEVRRLAAENPDFVYESYHGSCFYNPTERAGKQYGACIFGQAFTNLGTPVPDGIDEDYIGSVLPNMGIETTLDQYEWAGTVQYQQDQGCAWALAVALADDERR